MISGRSFGTPTLHLARASAAAICVAKPEREATPPGRRHAPLPSRSSTADCRKSSSWPGRSAVIWYRMAHCRGSP